MHHLYPAPGSSTTLHCSDRPHTPALSGVSAQQRASSTTGAASSRPEARQLCVLRTVLSQTRSDTFKARDVRTYSDTTLPAHKECAAQYLRNRNPNCRVSLSTLERTDLQFCLTLYFDNKRNCGDGDPVHSIHLLIHHRAVDCGVKNRPDGIRFGPNPGSLVQPCQPFQHIPHHQSFSNTTVLLSLLFLQGLLVDSPVHAGLRQQIPEPRAPQT